MAEQEAAAVVGLLRAGLSPRDAFLAVEWGEPGPDGAPSGASAPYAVAARLAHHSGAALAPILEACAHAALEEDEAAVVREAALAGPRLSARVLAWLPAVGLALAVLVDASVVAVLATSLGMALVAVGLGLSLVGRWWMHRLVARASATRRSAGLTLHAVRAAMLAGADVASALASVAAASAPEPGYAADAAALVRVAQALGDGEPWARAWAGANLEVLEASLRLPWERGAHAAPILAAAAAAEAIRCRREAQVAAGELSVRLSIPLALCLLPAFLVVGIVPLLVSLVGGIR